jgi:hypothetical protein
MTDLSLHMPPIRTLDISTLFSLLSVRQSSLNENKNLGINVNNPLFRLGEQHPTSNVQLIIDALADYAKEIGIHLFENSFTVILEQSNSLEAILQLLQRREEDFDESFDFHPEYRGGNWRLVNCLSPAVKVHHTSSDMLGEAATVSRACHVVALST